MFIADSTQLNTTIQQSSNVLKRITDTLFNTRSLITLVVALAAAGIVGRLLATLMRNVTQVLSRQADKTENLATVNRLRRFETIIILSIALVRALLVVLALYFWWVFTHPNQQPGAIIGASALFALIIGGVLSPLLRDMASGSVMMAEHWFGIGDYVTIEPFANLQGIVERVTLRSVKIRGLSGEIIWLNNQNIAGVRITPKGLRAIAVELFVSNPDEGAELVDMTSLRVPTGSSMLASPLSIMTTNKVADNLWHITAIGEVPPGREWLLEDFAVKIIQELDEAGSHVLAHEPITRFTDSEAEKRFARTIRNSRKPKIKHTVRHKSTNSRKRKNSS
jgi:hypothetical protein